MNSQVRIFKLVIVQQDATLQSQGYHDYKLELSKWTYEDELVKLDKDTQQSKDARVLQFKNYVENWEAERINLKSEKCRSSLSEKYTHMYLLDEGEVRRVVDTVWSAASHPAKYQAATQFIEMIDADENGEEEDVNYIINDELHKCIKAGRDIPNKSYNSEVQFVAADYSD